MTATASTPSTRQVQRAVTGDPDLGPFALLPGTWANRPGLPGRGWNMIALPFAQPAGSTFRPNYRLLLNQYDEVLNFTLVDKAVPNRGIGPVGGVVVNTDQTVVTLDYEQGIRQIKADDFPRSGLAGAPDLAIHHEPGLFLNMLDQIDGPDIARLATIPHGDAALALGTATAAEGVPAIPTVNALPIGVDQDVDGNPYLLPYKHFRDAPFEGLFDPTDPTALLTAANQDPAITIHRTTKLEFDTTVATGGIHNIPFIVSQANASEMKSTFWIQEITDASGAAGLRLQYVQVVQLDFFPRSDGGPGRIKWPHVSINTLEKQSDVAPAPGYQAMP
ncbi:MAG: heme-binding protein [Pseudonocardiales bacterium]|nr:heme-binding protein [Pseudonocardiales bacterium]